MYSFTIRHIGYMVCTYCLQEKANFSFNKVKVIRDNCLAYTFKFSIKLSTGNITIAYISVGGNSSQRRKVLRACLRYLKSFDGLSLEECRLKISKQRGKPLW